MLRYFKHPVPSFATQSLATDQALSLEVAATNESNYNRGLFWCWWRGRSASRLRRDRRFTTRSSFSILAVCCGVVCNFDRCPARNRTRSTRNGREHTLHIIKRRRARSLFGKFRGSGFGSFFQKGRHRWRNASLQFSDQLQLLRRSHSSLSHRPVDITGFINKLDVVPGARVIALDFINIEGAMALEYDLYGRIIVLCVFEEPNPSKKPRNLDNNITLCWVKLLNKSW